MSYNKITNFLIFYSFIFSINLTAMQKKEDKTKRYSFEDLEIIAERVKSEKIKPSIKKKIKYVKGIIKDKYKD